MTHNGITNLIKFHELNKGSFNTSVINCLTHVHVLKKKKSSQKVITMKVPNEFDDKAQG